MGKRLFVSVDLDGLHDAVAAVQERFEGASGLRFTDPEQAHVTLKFLGDTDEDDLPALVAELAAAVEEAGVEPFTADVGGLGVFPSLDYISVVWVGVGETDDTAGDSDTERRGGPELRALHEAVEDRTVALGFDPEDHEFTPHATVGRMDHAGGKELVQERVREDDPDVGELSVTELRLKESVLGPEGPTYSTIERFEL